MLSGLKVLNRVPLKVLKKVPAVARIQGRAMRALLLDCNAQENNRFQGESQKLCREIFMARITILVYSIQLVMIRKATLHPQAVNDLIKGAASVKLLS